MASSNTASTTNSTNTILVEKHYIPIALYRELYQSAIPQGLTSVHNTASATAAPSNSDIPQSQFSGSQRPSDLTSILQMINTFFPRNNTSSATTTGTNRQQSQQANNSQAPDYGYADLLSFFSNPSGSSMANTGTNNPATPSSRFRSTFTRRTETRTPGGNPIVIETASGTIPLSGESGNFQNISDTINVLMGAFLNTQQVPAAQPTYLTPNQITANSRTFIYNSSIDLDTTECPICTSEWENDEEIRKLNMCRHYFHRSCIDRWLGEHVSCPLCRVNVIPPDINEVD